MNSHFFLLFSNYIQWCNDVINNSMITDDCVLIDERTKRALKAWHKLPVWIRNTEYKNELNKAKCEQNSQWRPRPMSPTNRETLSSPKVRITALWNFPSELFGPDKKKKSQRCLSHNATYATYTQLLRYSKSGLVVRLKALS